MNTTGKSKADVLLGIQWGDEGKGKIIDILSPCYDIIGRFQGGPNAGHTLVFEEEVIVLHTIPSGILNSNAKNLIGGNVLINPILLCKEIDKLRSRRLSKVKNLYISNKANLILPTHIFLDKALEQRKGKDSIGSTKQGIGPAYIDKTGRVGIRIGWHVHKEIFKQKVQALVEEHLKLLELYEYSCDMKLLEQEMQVWMNAVESLSDIPKIDCEQMLNSALEQGKKVLIEGAQGTLLDIDMGSYPFVTSCNTTSGGVCATLGISPQSIGEVRAVFKAYCTRVGNGPFLTKITDTALAKKIREKGAEYGSTTGRQRDIGWLDIEMLKYAIRINGVTQLVLMKSDVLSDMPVKLCVGYVYDQTKKYLSSQDYEEGAVIPVYEDMESWGDLTRCLSYDEFPQAFKNYVQRIEELVGMPIHGISTGPDRTEYIERTPLMA